MGAPPLPPPRTTSDPNYNINKSPPQAENHYQNNSTTTKKSTLETTSDNSETINENNNDSTNLSVTYFSSGLNGHGIERETIFTDDRHSTDAASIVRQHLGGTGSNPFVTSNNHSNSSSSSSKNPFLNSTNAGDKHNESLDDIVEKKIQDLINANPFNNATTNGSSGNGGNGNTATTGNGGGKFNTIGRSNPFSSPNASKNPFLDQQNSKITSSGEDVNDSPDSSLEPEDNELHDAPSINKIETSFASNQPVTRSLSSVTSNNKSKLPMPTSVNGQNNSVSNQNRINNAKKTDLERISPWLVSSEAITTKKEKEKSKIPQLKTVITTEL